MAICPFAPYGFTHGPKTCQICQKLGPDFAELISLKPLDEFTPFKVSWTCLNLWSCSTIVICPFGPYGLGIYTIWSSMELSIPVVVQNHGHLTLTLDFQGQILKMLYLRNGSANWHQMKKIWVDRMLDPHCDFELWPHPWPWPFIFKVKFWKSRNSGMGYSTDMEQKGCESTECWTHVVTFNFDLTHHFDLEFSTSNFEIAYPRNGRADRHGTKGIWVDRVLYLPCDLGLWPWPWIFKVKFWKCCISGMGGPIDMEPKGCELIGC